MGEPTGEMAGRLTQNPVKHLDTHRHGYALYFRSAGQAGAGSSRQMIADRRLGLIWSLPAGHCCQYPLSLLRPTMLSPFFPSPSGPSVYAYYLAADQHHAGSLFKT